MLLERDQELDLLDELRRDVGETGGRVVLIRGEAGTGKSALVREAIRRWTSSAQIYVGTCDDLLTPRPLSPFWDMARQVPNLKLPLHSGDRSGLVEGVVELLTHKLRPTILVIEDSHWADEASLDAIKYLGRRISSTFGLMILTYRDGEVDHDHPLRGVLGDLPPQSVVRVKLGPLSLAAVSSLVEASGLTPDEVMRVTGGNPFFVTEMVAAGEGVPSSSIEDSVLARFRRLSPRVRNVVSLLAVIPERIPRELLQTLTGGSEAELSQAERRGFLEVRDGVIAFRHELIRATLERSLTESERVAANEAVLRSLPKRADPAWLVHHASEAGDVEALIEYAPRAAATARAVGSHREAVAHYRRLSPHLERLEPDAKGGVLDDWAREEFLIDNIREAIRLNAAALAHHRIGGDAEAESWALVQAALYHEVAGMRAEAERLARQAVDVLGPAPAGNAMARALEINAYLQMMAGNVALTMKLVDDVLAAAGPDVDDRTLVRSLNHRGLVANIVDYPRGSDDLERARHRSMQTGQGYEEARALVNLAWAAAEVRDLGPASEYVQAALESAVDHEVPVLESYAKALHARVLEMTGDWGLAEDLARDQLDRSEIAQMAALPVVGIIESRTGRSAARANLTLAWEKSRASNEFQRLAPAAAAVAEHAWITGEVLGLPADLRQVMEEGLLLGFSWSPGAIAVGLWRLGELSRPPDGVADPYVAMIAGNSGAAATLWKEVGAPYERALALAHGDVEMQLESVELMETLGAGAVAAKLRRSLRDRGVSVPRGRSRTTRSHAAGLTARQAEVLALLAESLTNADIADRLFLSPRTVEHHVASILGKLDASSREEAVRLALDQGLLTQS